MPTTLAMRRAFAALLAAAAAVAVLAAPPARSAQDDNPRAQRAALLIRIAELTDRMEDTQAEVVVAQLRQATTSGALARARSQLRERALVAYMYGAGVTPAQRSGSSVYLDVALAKERAVLGRVRAARQAAEADRATAETVRTQLRATERDLGTVRAQLDAAVAADDARRAEEERRADEARRKAMAAQEAARAASKARGELTPRHRHATQKQIELMGRYPFGPLAQGAPLPATFLPTAQRIEGKASWYGPGFDGRATASGAIYDQEGWTVASRDLPLGTILLVSRGDRRVILLVNDRGPYVYDRVLDLSHAAARHLGVGVTPVVAEVLRPA